MTENKLLFQISNIVNSRLSFRQAIARVAILLEREANSKGLFIDQFTELSHTIGPLDSLYSVDLRAAGQTLGKVTLCFASDRCEGPFQQRLADFVGQQFGMLLARTRLAERRARLRTEIAAIEEDLATRKIMQRAEGILLARGIAPSVARHWISQQSRSSVERIIAYHQATGLLEQKIA